MKLDDLIAKLQKIRNKEGNIKCICAEAYDSAIDIPYPARIWIRKLGGRRVVVFPCAGVPLEW